MPVKVTDQPKVCKEGPEEDQQAELIIFNYIY